MNEELKKEFDGLLVSVKTQVKDQFEELTENFKGNEQLKENLTNLEKGLESLSEKVKDLNNDSDLNKLKESMGEIEDIVKMQGTLIEANKNSDGGTPERITFKQLANKFVDSDEFNNYKEKATGESERLELKTVSLTDDYVNFANAPATLTAQTGVVIQQPYQMADMRARDIIPSAPIDVPFVISEEIIDWVNTIDVNSENGTLVEFSFKAEPKTFQKKRIGAYVKISKDMMQSRSFIVSQVETTLPSKYYRKENQEIFRGSGTGEHVLGLFANPNVRTFALTGTFAATAFASVASFGDGTKSLVTFAADHGLWDGYSLTIANSTNYNATYVVTVHTKTKIVIEAAYVAEATAAWTGTFTHPRYQKVVTPNLGDVASNAMRSINNGFNRPSGIIVNPFDASDLEDLKDTTGQYIIKFHDAAGNLVVNRVPLLESHEVPQGEMWLGDFANSAFIWDYRGLEMYMSTDVSYDLSNQVALIIEGHIILANYNPLAFMKVNIAQAITDLTKS